MEQILSRNLPARTKAALRATTRGLAKELAAPHIRVTAAQSLQPLTSPGRAR